MAVLRHQYVRNPDPQQRAELVSRLQPERWRSDPSGQDLVVLLVPRSENRGAATELPVYAEYVRNAAVESVGQGHVSGESEQPFHRLLPVGAEDPAESAAAEHVHLRLARLDQRAG